MRRTSLGRFAKGTHWRTKKPFWNKRWLAKAYSKQSAGDIAREFGVTDGAILFWLKKHAIQTRTVSEARAKKRWGLIGAANGMFGRTGRSNPNWNGGHSPERQSLYARSTWKALANEIRARDGHRCTRCGARHANGDRLIVHHIKPWARYPRLRFTPSNLRTLCERCHQWYHRRQRT